MEAICLDVTVQQVSPGWGISKHLSWQRRREKIQHHRLNMRNVQPTRSLSQHTRLNKAVFTRFPARVHAAPFALSVARGGQRSEEENAEAKRERWGGLGGGCVEEQPRFTMAAQFRYCFCLNVTGLSFDCPPPISPGRQQSCTCAWRASALGAALWRSGLVKDPA